MKMTDKREWVVYQVIDKLFLIDSRIEEITEKYQSHPPTIRMKTYTFHWERNFYIEILEMLRHSDSDLWKAIGTIVSKLQSRIDMRSNKINNIPAELTYQKESMIAGYVKDQILDKRIYEQLMKEPHGWQI